MTSSGLLRVLALTSGGRDPCFWNVNSTVFLLFLVYILKLNLITKRHGEWSFVWVRKLRWCEFVCPFAPSIHAYFLSFCQFTLGRIKVLEGTYSRKPLQGALCTRANYARSNRYGDQILFMIREKRNNV